MGDGALGDDEFLETGTGGRWHCVAALGALAARDATFSSIKFAFPSARSIIIMAEGGGEAEENDARAVRVVLSLVGLGCEANIVCELCDVDNSHLVKLMGKSR